ncbi:plasmid mobilization relaxosome protein MobC [Campylobacter sp. RM12640]|uniref:plasmid mobilization relaxosome protein MobC n=2 Tax=Campylobacteraceae TaxID=72294 RepID=UPI001EFA4CE1|nr:MULTISPECIES: plasmid mobilization relaxosome protein MobC [Campylobacter]MBZ7982807.1 plasmid mobilization relaxosome protein MobC [Campylobacter sp. RM12640]MCR8700349.1 plasmid mobilization relaxosome protein MobC [Campylobacter ureolyticus]ULO04600.1 putative mobilization protein MobC [Campylobacter sp. RM12651]
MEKLRQVKINFTNNDYQKIQALADANKTTKANVIRQILNNNNFQLETQKILDKKQNSISKEAREILYLFSNVSNNINQIARFCNIERDINKTALDELIKIKEYCKDIVDFFIKEENDS